MGFAQDQPVTVLASRVVSNLPTGRHNRAFADFDNAITGAEAARRRSVDELNMRPLITVVVDVIGNLAEKNTLGLQDAIGFTGKWAI